MYTILKFIISLIIIVSCHHNLHAQTITLSSEIIWKKKDVYLLNYDTVNVPFLRLNYKNNTADSIYFYNSLRSDWGFSEYLNFNYYPGFLINITFETQWKGLINSFPNWSDNEYVVTIAKNDKDQYGLSFLLYKKGDTNIKRENIEKSNEHNILNILIALLQQQSALDRDSTNLQYECFHHPDKIASAKKILDYYMSQSLNYKNLIEEVLAEQSKKSVYDNCVFLAPGSSFSFEYDLTPFFLLKGSYNFILKPKLPKSVTLTETIALPKVYNGYKLYTGKVNGIDVVLTIPE